MVEPLALDLLPSGWGCPTWGSWLCWFGDSPGSAADQLFLDSHFYHNEP